MRLAITYYCCPRCNRALDEPADWIGPLSGFCYCMVCDETFPRIKPVRVDMEIAA